MRRRLLRRGEATISHDEILTNDGSLVFGAVEADEGTADDWMNEISRITGLPPRFMLWDRSTNRIEIPLSVAEAIAEEASAPVSMVEVLPTHERLEVTMVRLNSS